MFSVASPLLDACVLSILEAGDTYGYALTQTLRKELGLSESALYPVLRRLNMLGALSTRDEAFQGRNRRYYSITELGKNMLKNYRAEWKHHVQRVETLLLREEKV